MYSMNYFAIIPMLIVLIALLAVAGCTDTGTSDNIETTSADTEISASQTPEVPAPDQNLPNGNMTPLDNMTAPDGTMGPQNGMVPPDGNMTAPDGMMPPDGTMGPQNGMMPPDAPQA